MNKNLNDYIKIYHNSIDDSICEQSVLTLNQQNWMKNTFSGYEKGDDVSLSENEPDVCYANIPTRGMLMFNIHQTLLKYITDLDFPWFNGWSGYTAIRFNRYHVGQEMAKHCDHITINDDGMRKGIPILSVIGALNDDYEGGSLIMFDDEEIRLKKGDIMVFPSSFQYPHRVAPVTKGVRDTFVSWVW